MQRPRRWRALRAVAIGAIVALVGALFVLSRLGQADPSVQLRRSLEKASYEGVEVTTARAASGSEGDVDVTILFDASGQPPAAVIELAERASAFAWKEARMDISRVTIRPSGGPSVSPSLTAAELRRAYGEPPASRERYGALAGRSRLVVLVALLAVLAMAVLVICAASAAVLVWKAGRRRAVTPAG